MLTVLYYSVPVLHCTVKYCSEFCGGGKGGAGYGKTGLVGKPSTVFSLKDSFSVVGTQSE